MTTILPARSDTGYWILAPGYLILDTGYLMLVEDSRGGCLGKAYAATGDLLGEDPTCYIHHTEKPEYLKWMNASH